MKTLSQPSGNHARHDAPHGHVCILPQKGSGRAAHSAAQPCLLVMRPATCLQNPATGMLEYVWRFFGHHARTSFFVTLYPSFSCTSVSACNALRLLLCVCVSCAASHAALLPLGHCTSPRMCVNMCVCFQCVFIACSHDMTHLCALQVYAVHHSVVPSRNYSQLEPTLHLHVYHTHALRQPRYRSHTFRPKLKRFQVSPLLACHASHARNTYPSHHSHINTAPSYSSPLPLRSLHVPYMQPISRNVNPRRNAMCETSRLKYALHGTHPPNNVPCICLRSCRIYGMPNAPSMYTCVANELSPVHLPNAA